MNTNECCHILAAATSTSVEPGVSVRNQVLNRNGAVTTNSGQKVQYEESPMQQSPSNRTNYIPDSTMRKFTSIEPIKRNNNNQ